MPDYPDPIGPPPPPGHDPTPPGKARHTEETGDTKPLEPPDDASGPGSVTSANRAEDDVRVEQATLAHEADVCSEATSQKMNHRNDEIAEKGVIGDPTGLPARPKATHPIV